MKAATGEVITAEELGGADTHGRKSGVVDHVAENDEHALAIVREIVATLNAAEDGRCRPQRRRARRNSMPQELYGIMPRDVRAPYDVREVIARIVDGSRVPRVQAALRHDPGLRLRAHLGHAGRHPGQQRRAVLARAR